LNAAQNVRGQLIKTARREVPRLYGLDLIADDAERRRTLEHLLRYHNAYIVRAADRGLPVEVRYLHLSWRGR
jgi:hypothetical protein